MRLLVLCLITACTEGSLALSDEGPPGGGESDADTDADADADADSDADSDADTDDRWHGTYESWSFLYRLNEDYDVEDEGEGGGWLKVGRGEGADVMAEGGAALEGIGLAVEYRFDGVLDGDTFDGLVVFNTFDEDAELAAAGQCELDEEGEDICWFVYEGANIERGYDIYYYGETWTWRVSDE